MQEIGGALFLIETLKNIAYLRQLSGKNFVEKIILCTIFLKMLKIVNQEL